jgi:hypothetical protein
VTLLGHASLKAALDCDWDDPQARQEGLQRLVDEAESLVRWVQQHRQTATQELPLSGALADIARVMTQDLEPDPSGSGRRLRRGTARDRLPSLGDREMRHGRKSKAQPFTGYKRHVLNLLGSKLVVDAVAQPANQAEHDALETLWPALEAHGPVRSLSIDRAYLSSPLIGSLKAQGIDILAKPWPLRNGGRFTKEQFQITLDRHVPRGGDGTPDGCRTPGAFSRHNLWAVCVAGCLYDVGTWAHAQYTSAGSAVARVTCGTPNG